MPADESPSPASPPASEKSLPAGVQSLVVVCSLEPWGEVRRRMQILVGILADAHPEVGFLYVEPPLDVPHALIRKDWAAFSRRKPKAGPVTLLRPLKWLPRVLGPFANSLLYSQVRKEASRISPNRPVLWVNDAHYAGLVSQTGWPSLYDVTDDWLLASMTARELDRLRADDTLLVKESDEVVVCSEDLARTRGRSREVHLIPNGVDVEMFSEPGQRPADLPASPTAVYVGSLHLDRLDLDLVIELADSLPRLQVVLVGPDSLDDRAHSQLSGRPNIHLLGARPYSTVPSYLHHADLVVIPHRVTPFTESLDPIKAYEVQAVGRPTVATAVAGFRDLGPPVVVASGSEFVESVARAAGLATGTRSLPSSGPGGTLVGDARSDTGQSGGRLQVEVASWRERADQMWSVLRGLIENAGRTPAGS